MKKYIIIIAIVLVSFCLGFWLRPVTADINRDGVVNEYDLSILMAQWTK